VREFKAIIFDMDGLLLDSERLFFDTFLFACNSLGLNDLTDLFYSLLGRNKESGERILRDGLTGIADFDEFSRIWDAEYTRLSETKPIPLMPGVKEILSHLECIGIPMAVATSTNTESAQTHLKASGILGYFDFVIGGDQVEHSKPDPEIYLKAASAMSLCPESCLAFEDSANGVRSAVSSGMAVVQIPDLVTPDADLLKLGHIVLDNIADALKFDFNS